MGQRKAPDADLPVFGPSTRLDYELELGVWIGQGNALGTPIPIGAAADHIAGLCLLNDWSARDFQAWEYQPLGPFLAKNFMSTVSPWVVTSEALAPFRTAQAARPEGDPRPLPYLWDHADQAGGALAIELSATLSTQRMREGGLPPYRLSRGPAANMYWTVAQIVTHHAANGCNLTPGDLLGTGTISAPSDDGYGSLLEISRGGQGAGRRAGRREPHLPRGWRRDHTVGDRAGGGLCRDRLRTHAGASSSRRAADAAARLLALGHILSHAHRAQSQGDRL